MNTLTTMVFQVLVYLPFTCIQTFLYAKTIGLNPKWKGLRLALVILCVTVAEAATHQISAIPALSWANSLILVIFFLYPVLFMGGKLKERILLGVINLAILLFIAMFLSLILYPVVNLSLDESWQSVLLFLVFAISIYAVYIILVLITIRLNSYLPHKHRTGIVIFFSVISVVFWSVRKTITRFADVEMSHMYAIIISLVLLIIWVLLYFVFSFICRYFAKANEANALAIQNDMIERYMLRKQASDDRIQVLSHDLRHSLTQWRTFAEEKGDADALQSISEYEGQLLSSLLIDVENDNANAIINQKHWEANQKQVEFLVDGVFHKDLIISKFDLSSLLSNLLDNAIEAAAQAETEALRRVKLSIRRKGNLLILTVENGYAIEPVLQNGVFVTTKKDKDFHAIGMRSIRYVAEKYDGVVHNSYENNWFKASVMLCGYQTALSDEK
ncbi:MAG: ATP-binding protein [Oscillospiraceae bacterium]|nr:ATP-binding protein [Oscillospiraceae bacterium]